jgi:hypothetical protein
MNVELAGSRVMMQQLQEAGHHVIKPNLFQVFSLKKKDFYDNFLVSRSAHGFHERDRFVFWKKRADQKYSETSRNEQTVLT